MAFRTISALIMLVLAAAIAPQTLSYGRAARISALNDVALQQQLNQEMILNLSYPELQMVVDRVFYSEAEHADLAVLALQLALETESRDGASWARLAYAHAASQGSWTAAASEALTESYFRMPYADRDFMLWRLQLAESYWSGLPDSLQADVVREARLANPAWLRTYAPRINARVALG